MTSSQKYDKEDLRKELSMEERKRGEDFLARSTPHGSDTAHGITQHYLAQFNNKD